MYYSRQDLSHHYDAISKKNNMGKLLTIPKKQSFPLFPLIIYFISSILLNYLPMISISLYY